MAKRQTELTGMETAELPKDLIGPVVAYKKAQRNRMRWLAKEIELKKPIIEKMHELKLAKIRDEEEDIEIELVPGKERLKVRTPSEEESEGEDGGDD